jgi:inosine-uridine nucleoside N-ribohydrolase
LLEAGLDAGATIVAIGPYTNLALAEQAMPASLARAPVVVMGGWLDPPAAGLPPVGPERDFNVAWAWLTAVERAAAR